MNSNPTSSNIFYLLRNVQTGSGRKNILSFDGCQASFPEISYLEREVGHSAPSIGGVKNGWGHTSTPSVCICGEGLKSLGFTFTFNFFLLLSFVQSFLSCQYLPLPSFLPSFLLPSLFPYFFFSPLRQFR